MKIDPNALAYPLHTSYGTHLGMPIRLEIAARLLAGMVVNVELDQLHAERRVHFSLSALALTDALLSEYNKGEE